MKIKKNYEVEESFLQISNRKEKLKMIQFFSRNVHLLHFSNTHLCPTFWACFYPCHTLLLSCNLPNKHGIYKQLVPNVDQEDVLEYLLGTEQILQKLVLPQILYHLVEFLCSS